MSGGLRHPRTSLDVHVFRTLVPVPAFTTTCGAGQGMAACATLGLLVTSSRNALTLFTLPRFPSPTSAPTLLHTLGATSAPPLPFRFDDRGYLAFTGPTASGPPLLLVTDAGLDAVHVVDVVGGVHVGYVAPPGTMPGPMGVAAKGSLVAVSTWKVGNSGDHVVHVYQGCGSTWDLLRVIGGGFGEPGSADGQLAMPCGVRFSDDGAGLEVADYENSRISLFRVGDGAFVRHLATEIPGPFNMEGGDGGWLVTCYNSDSVEFVGDSEAEGDAGARAVLGKNTRLDGERVLPSALAWVPGLGLLVRELRGDRSFCVQLYATPQDMAMGTMSVARVGWMTGVVRAILRARS